MSRLLNFGCGSVFHPDWVNLDTTPAAPGVIAHDLRHGMPFPDESFDGVYGSHVLEHLQPLEAKRTLAECFRVLRPGGVVRLVVPNLEAIARLYLQNLDGALAGNAEAERRYDWIMLELYDQTVRTFPGGSMGVHLRGALDDEQARFIATRIGCEAMPSSGGRRPRRLSAIVAAVRRRAAGFGAYLFLGAEGRDALREGLFRRSGEVHQWMYDRFSMQRALEQAGFADVRCCGADESAIPRFAGYGLDTTDGRARKPDSLYVEARKPGVA